MTTVIRKVPFFTLVKAAAERLTLARGKRSGCLTSKAFTYASSPVIPEVARRLAEEPEKITKDLVSILAAPKKGSFFVSVAAIYFNELGHSPLETAEMLIGLEKLCPRAQDGLMPFGSEVYLTDLLLVTLLSIKDQPAAFTFEHDGKQWLVTTAALSIFETLFALTASRSDFGSVINTPAAKEMSDILTLYSGYLSNNKLVSRPFTLGFRLPGLVFNFSLPMLMHLYNEKAR